MKNAPFGRGDVVELLDEDCWSGEVFNVWFVVVNRFPSGKCALQYQGSKTTQVALVQNIRLKHDPELTVQTKLF